MSVNYTKLPLIGGEVIQLGFFLEVGEGL